MSRRNLFFPALVFGALMMVARASADEALAVATTAAAPAPTIPAPAVATLAAASPDDKAPAIASPATNQPAFNASIRGGETVGEHQVQRAFLTVGSTQIAFIVPNDFSMDASDSQKIVLSDNAGRYFITLRVRPGAGDADVDIFRSQVLARFPGAKITSQFSEFAGEHAGHAFDLEWMSPSGGAQSLRIVFLPSSTGVLEFSVLTPTANFKDAQLYLRVLLSSIRSNEKGKLVIVPLPDVS